MGPWTRPEGGPPTLKSKTNRLNKTLVFFLCDHFASLCGCFCASLLSFCDYFVSVSSWFVYVVILQLFVVDWCIFVVVLRLFILTYLTFQQEMLMLTLKRVYAQGACARSVHLVSTA